MSTNQVMVQRFSLTSSKSFEEVVAGLEAAVGRPHMDEFLRDVASTKPYAELEKGHS